MKRSALQNRASSEGLLPFINMESMQPGVVYFAFANTSALQKSTFLNRGLTTYLSTQDDPDNLWQYLERLLPSVQVNSRLFDYKRHDKASDFVAASDYQRGIRGKYKTVDFLGDEVIASIPQLGATTLIDEQEADNPNIEKSRTDRISQMLARSQLVQFLTLLDAVSQPTPKKWSAGAPDPDSDIYNLLDADQKQTGIWRSHLWIGEDAWLTRRNCYRPQATAGAIASAQMKAEDLAADLRLRRVVVDDRKKSISSSTLAPIVGSSIYLYSAWDGTDRNDPSDFKRFWKPAAKSGEMLAVYREEHSHGIQITVWHNSLIVTASGNPCRKLIVN
jgi:hypothetical protein